MNSTKDLETSPCPENQGFTLIELLVVIAIIAILAAILLPVLARAKEEGWKANCISNLHQCGIGVVLYCDDNGQVFPMPGATILPRWWTPGSGYNAQGLQCGCEWMVGTPGSLVPNTPAPMIAPYVKNPSIFVCPKRRRGLTYTTTNGIYDPSVTGFLSYGFNDINCFAQCSTAFAGYDGMGVPTQQFKATMAYQPANLICMTEVSGSNNPQDCDGTSSNTVTGDAAWLDGEWAGNVPQNYHRLQTAWAKHDNKVNVLFLDGHVDTALVSQLTWGQFWGVYGPPSGPIRGGGYNNTIWPALPAPMTWNGAVGTPALDITVWDNSPE
jgi:prepilin-type N-terminal cleavage/methylation domain-containing protein/prepilin-type processing-associated H-X9-DG protein